MTRCVPHIVGRLEPKIPKPPPLLQREDIPIQYIELIKAASNEVFGITSPRSFQYAGAHHIMFNNDIVMAVPQKTADGKTLIVQLASFF